jgi:hypothetical protein
MPIQAHVNKVRDLHPTNRGPHDEGIQWHGEKAPHPHTTTSGGEGETNNVVPTCEVGPAIYARLTRAPRTPPPLYCTATVSLSLSLSLSHTQRQSKKRNKKRERESARSFCVYLYTYSSDPTLQKQKQKLPLTFPHYALSLSLSTISHLISLISLPKKHQPYFRLLQPDDEHRSRASVTLFYLQGNALKHFGFL